jgi:hypothetical protein
MTYMLHPRGKATGSTSTSLALSNLIHTKLAIQGVVHCSSCRWKFNLTTFTETLVYQTVVRTGTSLNGHLRFGGGLLDIYMDLAHINNSE